MTSDFASLRMELSILGAEALVLFLRHFGGRLRVEKAGTRTQLPTLYWSVHGERARRAGEMLSHSQLGKQRQLALFSRGLPCPGEEREAAKELLSE